MPVTIAFPPRIKPYPTAGQSLGMGLEQVPGVATHGILSIIAQQLAKGGEEDKQKGIMNLAHEQNMERDQAKNAGDIQRDWLGAGAQTAGQKEILMEQGRQQGISREGALAAELALQAAKPKSGPNYFKMAMTVQEKARQTPDKKEAGKLYRLRDKLLRRAGHEPPPLTQGETDPMTKEEHETDRALGVARIGATSAEAKAKADADRAEKQREGSWRETLARVWGGMLKGGPFDDPEEKAKAAQALEAKIQGVRPQSAQGGAAPEQKLSPQERQLIIDTLRRQNKLPPE